MDSERCAGAASSQAAALAWYGNAAKMRIIARVVADGQPKTVFDFGAGGGAGWAETLRLHPEITLIAYEPHPPSARRLRRSVPTAQVYDGDAAKVDAEADIAVSFSVFEHVADRPAYLRHAMRSLRPGGTFFLNYDDGHFRHPGSTLDALRNRLAPILPSIGLKGLYQATVRKDDADRMVAEAGFVMIHDRYENLEGMKELAKTIPPGARADFARIWLALEDELNARFCQVTGRVFHGDATNLWRELASRTLELRKP